MTVAASRPGPLAADVVRRYFAACARGDRSAMDTLLSPAFSFGGPDGAAGDRAAFLDVLWPARAGHRIDVESLVGSDREVVARYACVAGDGTRVRAVDWFAIEGERIASISTFADASLARSATTQGIANPTADARANAAQPYACLVHQQDDRIHAMSDEALRGNVAACLAWLQALEASGRHVFSTGLQAAATATSLRHRGGHVSTTDGPFTETNEHLAGFTIFSARDYNEAIAIASGLAQAAVGTVELRPLLTLASTPDDPVDRRIAAAIRACSGA